MFWIGASLPIITFFLKKKFPKSRFLEAVHWPIFFAGTGNLPPAVCIIWCIRHSRGLANGSTDRHQLYNCIRGQLYLQ